MAVLYVLRLNIGDPDAVFQAEDVEDVDKDLLKGGRHHDVHWLIQTSWLRPEIVVATFKQLDHGGKGGHVLCLYLVHLVTVSKISF